MTVKAVFSDVDGTLLNSDHKITSLTKRAIQKVVKSGVPFVLVTARMPGGVVSLQEELAIHSPIICYSGALVLEENSEGNMTPIHSTSLSRQETGKILGIVNDRYPTISISLYSYNEWLVRDTRDAWVTQEQEIIHTSPTKADFAAYLENNQQTHKILCMGNSREINDLEQTLKNETTGVSIYKSKETYLEIMDSSASKSQAIQIILQRLGLSREEIMAIGDNFNDIDMLSFAGLGIAMANAPDEVKRYADDVTLSNDKDGLKYSLEKYVIASEQ
ncbi:Cof-type HAD-IIB family hydrolase [Paenibacillus jilunlii]|uniref:Cof subfamily of IIB subfamily of haloacid dehalogenase superfamily/HAD-superfamily hydrolase, subfamily IIB n=1 Tax=Paenibacillus jilunlii TaxID=682956 RepID=A0A1G9FTV8_9BACL|nr:Cof-type HAD-IIB family hydrolase [Paenibacillus jilunlii]KWX71231.1 hypothetical protein AML91_23590 [Paenibacillus jilunlii]SDK91824.1 hypothetical protein SAMN05216191_10187 [Paenibacillus jilunlii]